MISSQHNTERKEKTKQGKGAAKSRKTIRRERILTVLCAFYLPFTEREERENSWRSVEKGGRRDRISVCFEDYRGPEIVNLSSTAGR